MKLVVSLAAGLLATATPTLAQPTRGTPAPTTLQPEEDMQHQYSASVIERTPLEHQGEGEHALAVHLYGTAGGDPAMNGLNTFIAFYQSPADGYKVFMIGDFNSYRVVSERLGEVVLQVDENIMSDAGEIGSRTRRLRVSWTPPADSTAPTTVRVADVR